MQRLRRSLCSLIALIVLLSVFAPSAFAASNIKAYAAKDMKVYSSPSTSSSSMKIPKGCTMQITAIKGDWAQVKRDGVTAYCALKNLNLKNRLKGYTSKKTPLYKSASSSSDTYCTLSMNTKVYIIGKDGDFFRVQNADASKTGYVKMSAVSDKKTSSKESLKKKVVAMDWYDGGSSVLKRGSYGYIYDIATGTTIRIKRMGGTAHADVEPATLADTYKLYNIVNGDYSWDSRAVILIAGGKYVAAAINTMPHGDQTITDNGYDGQFCLHMLGSKTHCSDKINVDHQASVKKAYNWAH